MNQDSPKRRRSGVSHENAACWAAVGIKKDVKVYASG